MSSSQSGRHFTRGTTKAGGSIKCNLAHRISEKMRMIVVTERPEPELLRGAAAVPPTLSSERLYSTFLSYLSFYLSSKTPFFYHRIRLVSSFPFSK
jgi:hypothetical protein